MRLPIIPQLLCVGFVMLLLYGLMTNIVLFYKVNHLDHVPDFPMPKPMASIQLDKTLNVPLFGDYLPGKLDGAYIKRSKLDVRVVGILYSTQRDDSQVIVQTADGTEHAFKMGDIIPGGAVIMQISPDGVVVKRDGVLESLSLPKRQLIFEPPAKPLN